MSSCRVRSLRACWRLFRADAMVFGRRRRLGRGSSRGIESGAVGRAREQERGEKGGPRTAGGALGGRLWEKACGHGRARDGQRRGRVKVS